LVVAQADQQAQLGLRLAARVVVLFSLPVAAVVEVALPQLTPPKPEGLAVSRVARPRARVAVLLQPQLTPAQRLLRVLLLLPSRAAAVRVVRQTTLVRVLLAVLVASPAVVAVAAVAEQALAVPVARAALAA